MTHTLNAGDNVNSVNALEQFLLQKGLRAPFCYDLKLFSALNDYYADQPLVPKPRELTPTGLFSQAEGRVKTLRTMLPDFAGKKCLEVGCGRGETAVELATQTGCMVTGVDVTAYPEWESRWSLSTKFLPVDICTNAPFAPNSFDLIYSFVVLEHVRTPYAMLNAMHSLLKPGGVLYFTANLYRGPMASHRYREVFFPWPHLLFDDDVFVAYYKTLGMESGGKPAWVNKLTHLHYLDQFSRLGFTVKRCNYTQRALDTDFFNCFIEDLEKYPQEDLELDFIKVQLTK